MIVNFYRKNRTDWVADKKYKSKLLKRFAWSLSLETIHVLKICFKKWPGNVLVESPYSNWRGALVLQFESEQKTKKFWKSLKVAKMLIVISSESNKTDHAYLSKDGVQQHGSSARYSVSGQSITFFFHNNKSYHSLTVGTKEMFSPGKKKFSFELYVHVKTTLNSSYSCSFLCAWRWV